jgi:hypothetical protein
VRLRPLVPRAPIVAGASVSFFGETVCDGRVDAKVPFLPRVDVLSLPPFRLLKAYLTGPFLKKAMTFPAAVHVPVLDFEHPAVRHLVSDRASSARGGARHALGITVLSARNLDAADVFGTSDPFVVVALAGEGRYESRAKKTTVKKRTLNPKWRESFTYVVADPSAARDALFAVFDSDGKGATARPAAPEKVRAKIAPVKALHLRALEVSERYLYRATRIPWAKAKPKRKASRRAEEKGGFGFFSAATKPQKPKLQKSRRSSRALGNGLVGDVSDVSDDPDRAHGARSSSGSREEKKKKVSRSASGWRRRAARISRAAPRRSPPPLPRGDRGGARGERKSVAARGAGEAPVQLQEPGDGHEEEPRGVQPEPRGLRRRGVRRARERDGTERPARRGDGGLRVGVPPGRKPTVLAQAGGVSRRRQTRGDARDAHRDKRSIWGGAWKRLPRARNRARLADVRPRRPRRRTRAGARAPLDANADANANARRRRVTRGREPRERPA